MTNSIPAQATHTKTNQTTVSYKTKAGSTSYDILKSLKAGTLRKNAKVKIAALLEVATLIELQTQSMGLDDCYDYNQAKVVDIEFFWAWYEKKYSHLEIYICKHNDVVSSVTFSDCPYHFSNDIKLTFEAIKEEAVNAEVVLIDTPLIKLADLSHLDVQALPVMNINNIEIIWSESNHFETGEILNLAVYNAKSTLEALEIGRGQGYAKTKITINTADGKAMVHRHDINADYPTLTVDLGTIGFNATQAEIKPVFTFEQVTQALDAGFISPLNHNRKLEPTPPTDSCNVVSLGDYKDRLEQLHNQTSNINELTKNLIPAENFEVIKVDLVVEKFLTYEKRLRGWAIKDKRNDKLINMSDDYFYCLRRKKTAEMVIANGLYAGFTHFNVVTK